MPSKEMVKRLLMNYRNGHIEQEHLQKLKALLSNNVFDESSMTGSKVKAQSEDQTVSDSEEEESNRTARSRSARQVQIKILIKPDEVTKLFDDILQTSVVSEVDEERTEQQYTKLMDLLHKFNKSHTIALYKYHTMPKACIDDQGRAEHNIIKGLASDMKSCIVHPHTDSLNSQVQFHKIQGSFMLLWSRPYCN